jgi:hypothetical protein
MVLMQTGFSAPPMYNQNSHPIHKREEAKLYLVIADNQTRVFLLAK